jgi:hypothetical protein
VRAKSDAVGAVIWEVSADKGYSYPQTIPERRDQRARRAAKRGRPLPCDEATFARRKVVERCNNRLKQW